MFMATVDLDHEAVKKLTDLFVRIEKETPLVAGDQVRRAGIYVCKSLAARTKVAPKQIPPKEYRADVSPNRPYYITTPRGLLHRWRLTRKLGTQDQNTHDYYVYTSAHRGRNGRMVGKKLAEERRELLKFHGQIKRRGIAKKSWGWIAKQIYSQDASGFGDLSYKRTKGERRDPRAAARGSFEQQQNNALAKIMNMLDYIGAIVPAATVNEAFTAAVNKLEHNINSHFEKAVA
jgi:hypothetical protein